MYIHSYMTNAIIVNVAEHSILLCILVHIFIIEKYVAVPAPEFEVFKKHYNDLTKMLFCTNLTPHMIQEGVILPLDQEEIKAVTTSSGKAEIVLQKVSFALEAGISESFYRILEIMKSFGNHDAQQLSITIEHEISGSQGLSPFLLK